MGSTGTELFEQYDDNVAALLPSTPQLEVLGEGFEFTEGPVWDFRTGELIFSDIPGNAMYRYRPGQGVEAFRDPSDNSNGTTRDAQNRLVICEHHTRRVVREDADGFTPLADNYQGTTLNAPNDVVLAPDGSLVFTDPHYGLGEGLGGPAEQVLGHRGVYRIPPDGGPIQLLVDDFDGPNGLAFDPSGTRLYIDDTEHAHIRVFDVADDWTVRGGDVLVTLEGDGVGVLDGLKIDRDGRIWSTGPGGIWIVSPEGRELGRIRIPEVAANLAWGDDDARSLYITASDKLYRLRTQVEGHVPYPTS